MQIFNKFGGLLLLLAAIILFNGCEGPSFQSETSLKHHDAILAVRNELPDHGVLEQGPDGYVYLKVPDDYVYRLFPLVKEPGFIKPDSIRRHTRTGAHISVFYSQEGQKIGELPELGKTYSFTPQEISIVRSGRKEFIILVVEAPELERLREHYGLSPLVQNHAFHITLAERRLRK